MSESEEEIQYNILKFYYKTRKNATQIAKEICDVYGPNAVSESSTKLVQVKRFQTGNFDVKDATLVAIIRIKSMSFFKKVEQDRHIGSYDIAEKLGIDHITVLTYLKKSGYTKTLDIWVPHELTERNLMNRVLISDSLLKRNETEPVLKRLITDDEKW